MICRYIRFIRLSGANPYYFTSQVWAEMKKSVAYKVDIKLDLNNVVEEAQCECGAGQGPAAHCKHVGACLFALTRLKTDGITYISEMSCTQVHLLLNFSKFFSHILLRSIQKV